MAYTLMSGFLGADLHGLTLAKAAYAQGLGLYESLARQDAGESSINIRAQGKGLYDLHVTANVGRSSIGLGFRTW